MTFNFLLYATDLDYMSFLPLVLSTLLYFPVFLPIVTVYCSYNQGKFFFAH